MPTRTRWGFKVAAALVLATGLLLGARVALSQKGQPAPPVSPTVIYENKAQVEATHKLVDAAISAKRWTMKDHDEIVPLFNGLRTEQKIEILKKVGAALDSKQLKLEKGARLF